MAAHLLDGHPVGLAGVLIMSAGGVAFFLSVLQARRAIGGAGEAGARRSPASILGIGLQMLAFASAGFGRVRIEGSETAPERLAVAAAVAALIFGAVLIFRAAARAMGRNWSLVARTREDHELVQHGVFARIRHPIYLAMGLFLLALAVSLGHERNLLVALPLFALGTAIRVRIEEELLRDLFGAAYGDYSARVKRFVPGLF